MIQAINQMFALKCYQINRSIKSIYTQFAMILIKKLIYNICLNVLTKKNFILFCNFSIDYLEIKSLYVDNFNYDPTADVGYRLNFDVKSFTIAFKEH